MYEHHFTVAAARALLCNSLTLALSKENFQRGRSVPSVSRNSSEASSQYLKSSAISL